MSGQFKVSLGCLVNACSSHSIHAAPSKGGGIQGDGSTTKLGWDHGDTHVAFDLAWV